MDIVMEESRAIQGPGGWEPYLDEMRSLYLDQGWPLKKLMHHMKSVRGINASIKQYKSLFTRLGWKKNATGSEWAALGAVIAKRKRDGKDTDVFVDGKLLGAKRLKRELSRYQNTADDVANVPPEVPSARFRVRTPLGYDRTIDTATNTEDITLETPHLLSGCQPPCATADGASADKDEPNSSSWFDMEMSSLEPSTFLAFRAESPSRSVGVPASESFSLINFSPDPWPNQSYTTPPNELYDQHWKDQMSPLDLSCLSDMNRMIWTTGLSFHTVLETLSQLESYDLLINARGELQARTPPVPLSLPLSWSVDGLKLLAAEVSSFASGTLSMKICHPILDIESASVFELLDLVVCSVICRPVAENIAVGRFHELLIEWFVDPRHLPVLEKLIRNNTSNFKVFARNLVEVAVRVICSNALPSGEVRGELKASILKTVTHLHACVIDSDILLPTYLLTVAASYGHVDLCNMLLRRGASIRSNGGVPGPLSSAIRCHQVATLKFLLDQGANLSDVKKLHTRDNITEGCIFNIQGFMLLSWRDYHRDQDPSQMLRVLASRSDPASGFAPIHTPCWEEFSALEICALVGQPHSVDPILYHQDLEPRNLTESPVARIARAAISGEEQLRALQAHQSDPVSSYDLEMALIGATALRSSVVVRRLLAVGTHPDCPALRSTQVSHYQRLHLHSRECIGRSIHEHPTRRLKHERNFTACILIETPLEVAGRTYGGGDIVALLLDAGATITHRFIDSLSHCDFLTKNKSTQTALMARLNHPEVLRGHGPNLMSVATHWANLDMVDFLMSQGVPMNFNAMIRSETSGALAIAIRLHDIAFLKAIWERGARFNGSSHGGWELILACNAPSDCEAKTQFLLEKGAAPNYVAKCTVDNRDILTTPLLQVVLQRRPESQLTGLMRTLISAGADPNLGVGIDTPLHWACFIGHTRAVQLLLEHGTQIRDSNILTWPINLESTGSAVDIIDLLIGECQSRGIDVAPGATKALGLAAGNGFIDIAIKLLDAGADVNGFVGRADTDFGGLDNVCCCCDGDATPIEVAAWNGWIDMVKLLINAGAEGDCTSSPGLHHVPAMPSPAAAAAASIDDLADLLPSAEHQVSQSQRDQPQRFSRAIRLARSNGHIHVVDLLKVHQ